ncbi:MAG: Rho termination factor N-terminal domain-containing protein, partial [Bacteroidota bacterium]
MYDITELNDKLVTELKEIARLMKVPNYDDLRKQELIYKILDQQALEPDSTKNIREKMGDKPKAEKTANPADDSSRPKRKRVPPEKEETAEAKEVKTEKPAPAPREKSEKLEPSVKVNPGRPERKPVTAPGHRPTPPPPVTPSVAPSQPSTPSPSPAAGPAPVQQPYNHEHRPQQYQRFENDRGFRPQHRRDFREPEAPIDPDSLVVCEGVLEVMPDGFGFLRSRDDTYLTSPDDVFLTPHQSTHCGRKIGDPGNGVVRP